MKKKKKDSPIGMYGGVESYLSKKRKSKVVRDKQIMEKDLQFMERMENKNIFGD